ncbi:MAG: hypothetical protein QOK05_615 [Chloroflexota bacterium]|jgi:3-phenylpropionate/trans-cinnamate dioxygenase ferredoxin subunit|nr:hypothetical protein [Chloroflexota bacterium]
MKHEVCKLDELPVGQMRSVMIDNVAVVVVHAPDGRLRALRDTCSHFGAQLSRGTLRQMVVGDTHGSYALSADTFVLQCPWHGYEYNIDNGQCPADPEHARVKSYQVTVQDGAVLVDR